MVWSLHECRCSVSVVMNAVSRNLPILLRETLNYPLEITDSLQLQNYLRGSYMYVMSCSHFHTPLPFSFLLASSFSSSLLCPWLPYLCQPLGSVWQIISVTPLKKMVRFPSTKDELLIFFGEWWGSMGPSSIHDDVLRDPILYRSCGSHIDKHSSSELMGAMALPCVEDTFILHISPFGSYILSVPSPVMSPEPQGGDRAVP